ncbi:TATA box-binding protein-associated factor RNA polymerase I subunit A isoform X1 [Polyodon spathula]|uniref:TATA box-binding protein-associated factor RNA polymerase I subunit A isoform X1 n=1 Tax=Polyodon spathula TaxID=7913 RepID=UPI001B7E0DE3|nr:TATA box-binding protein-associated factor RNA polymerase I subunit A isoform X1 [Polyodon spathula]
MLACVIPYTRVMDDLCEELLTTVEQEEPERYDQHTSILQPGFPLSLPPKLQLPLTKRGRKESGFHKTERICLRQIREALLQHQWQKASALMTNYFQNIEDTSYRRQRSSCERFWRIGTEILRHHPRSKIDDFNSFLDRMKNIGVKNYLKICLEHSFHLLCDGMLEDANRQLSLAESWRCRDTCAAQQQMIQGYRGLLDYYTWVKKCDTLTETEKYDYAAATAKQDMQSYFRQASVNLQAIIEQPGVWDPFILSYVNMLEFYEDHDAALQMLYDYAYDNKFPPNPNAHVYLYQFLKRHRAPWRKLVKVLRILQLLVPSHELMLELCSLLAVPDKRKYHHEALKVLFSLLDYSSWKDNPDVWKSLEKTIQLVFKVGGSAWVKEEWASRKGWWPAFHFSAYQAKKNLAENEPVACSKAFVAGLLIGKECKYFKTIYKGGRKKRSEILKKMKKYITNHSLAE